MTTTALEHAAHTHARNIRTPEHRDALARLLEDAHDLVNALDAGLRDSQPDGLQVDDGVNLDLDIAKSVLDTLARRVRDGEVWMTEAVALRRAAREEARRRQFTDNPVYGLTVDQLKGVRSDAFALGMYAADLVDA
jgi:hypothetical protein